MHQATAPCVCTSLRKASRAISRIYDAALAPLDISSAQLSILRTVDRAGALPLSRLAEQLVMDRTSLYRALEPMRRAGWLSIDDAPVGRAKIVSLTDAGRTLRDDAAPLWDAAQHRVVDAFGDEAWAALHTGIVRLTDVGVAARDGGSQS